MLCFTFRAVSLSTLSLLVDLIELEFDNSDLSETDEFLTSLRLKVLIGPMSFILTNFASVEAKAEFERSEAAELSTERFLFRTAFARAIFLATWDSFEFALCKEFDVDM
jgi:hypothetical protein